MVSATSLLALSFFSRLLQACEGGKLEQRRIRHLRSHHHVKDANPSSPLVWRRPSWKRPVAVNGSLVIEDVNTSGCPYSNTVCGSTIDISIIVDVGGSVGNDGVLATKLFLARLLPRFRLGRDQDHQLFSLVEAGMSARLLSPLTDSETEIVAGINKLSFPGGGACNLVPALSTAETSFSHGRQDAHSLIVVIADGPALRQRLTLQMVKEVSKTSDLMVLLVASEFDTAARQDATEWLKTAGSCTPYGCRLLQIDSYEKLGTVDTTGVLAEICPNLV